MKNRIFHTVKIADKHYDGHMTDFGPYLLCRESKIDIAISPAVLYKYKDSGETFGCPPNQDPAGWWVAKYDTQLRIDLRDFTDEQAEQLASEFGLSIYPLGHGTKFFDSPAWGALVAWAENNPRIAKSYANSQNYDMGWYARAQEINENKKVLAVSQG